jgi:dTDP-4-amino-4,6-dideoxygalactose transaminase
MESFEAEFAEYCGVSNAVAVASGTDALSIGLTALGVGREDDVLVPAVSAAATAMAVVMAGARPVFVDIARDHFMMDPGSARERKTARTKVVMPVHLYGMPAPLAKLEALGLDILEDAAQAHGAQAPWGRCGTFGRAGAFSFYPTKNLGTYGDGGMLITREPAIADRARLLRNYGQRETYSSETLGRNSRLDDLHAAILRVKLRCLDEWNGRRRLVAAQYRKAFADLPVTLQADTGEGNGHLFVLCTPERDRLRKHLSASGIPTLVHYPIPLPRQKAFAQFDPASARVSSACPYTHSCPMKT